MSTHPSRQTLTELSPLRNSTQAADARSLVAEQLRHFSIDPQSAHGQVLARVAEHLYATNLAVHDLWKVRLS